MCQRSSIKEYEEEEGEGEGEGEGEEEAGMEDKLAGSSGLSLKVKGKCPMR